MFLSLCWPCFFFCPSPLFLAASENRKESCKLYKKKLSLVSWHSCPRLDSVSGMWCEEKRKCEIEVNVHSWEAVARLLLLHKLSENNIVPNFTVGTLLQQLIYREHNRTFRVNNKQIQIYNRLQISIFVVEMRSRYGMAWKLNFN